MRCPQQPDGRALARWPDSPTAACLPIAALCPRTPSNSRASPPRPCAPCSPAVRPPPRVPPRNPSATLVACLCPSAAARLGCGRPYASCAPRRRPHVGLQRRPPEAATRRRPRRPATTALSRAARAGIAGWPQVPRRSNLWWWRPRKSSPHF